MKASSADVLATSVVPEPSTGVRCRRSRAAAAVASFLAVAVLTILPGAASAQEPRDTALALGGGGARGIAHAGVLAGLERRGHDPDLIVGTSMGAIVGALYAAGYSADEVWRIMAAENWPELFVPTPLPVGPERGRRHPLVRLGLGGEPLESIWGVVPDWRIDRRLVRLLFDAGVRARGDFDRLPRRFRAIAADLETGDVVVIGAGDLALAVRASMAVPGFFSPVSWNGRVLVDGGIASNLPIVQARELGAGVVIAVDVIRPPPTLEGDDPVVDPIDVGSRAFRLLLENTLPEGVHADALVLPDISPDVSSAAFPRDATPLLRAGLQGALRDLPLAGGPRPERRRPPPPPSALGDLVVETSDTAIAALVRAAFRDAAPGPYRPEAVLEAVDRLYATGFIDAVWPRVTGRAGPPDDRPTLVIRADPAPRTALAGAAGYEADRGFRAWATLAHRIDAGAPAELGFGASADGIDRWVSAAARLASLRLPPVVWTAGAHFRDTDARRVLDGDILGETDVDRLGGSLGLEVVGIEPGLTITALLHAEHVDVEAGETGLSAGPVLRITDPAPFTRVVGLPARFELELRGGDVDYARLHVRGSARGARGRLRVAAIGDVVVTGGDAPPDVLPALGDEHLLPGLRWDEARGRTRFVGGIDVAYPALLGGFARLELRAGAAPGDVDLETLVDDEAWTLGAGLGLVWPTPFGSIEIGFGANTRDRWRVEIDVGPPF